jgi:LMBR1 domain-containing protein 1
LKGEVVRTDNFNESQAYSKLGNPILTEEVVAVHKKQQIDSDLGRPVGNITTVVTTSHLMDRLRTMQRNTIKSCLQKFLHCRGHQAFICRTIYTRGKLPHCYLITNSEAIAAGSYLTDKNSNIIKVTTGRFLIETSKSIANILRFTQAHMKIQFDELACDFIKDEGGNWWLINVKAFQISKHEVPDTGLFQNQEMMETVSTKPTGLKEYKKLKRCEFCNVGFEKLSHKLTLKMIFEMEELLRRRGKVVSWLKNKEYRRVDEATLYQNYYVCDYCFKLYTETQVLRTLELTFAKAFNIPTRSEEVPAEQFELQTEVALRVVCDDPTSQNSFYSLNKFRVLVVLHELRDTQALEGPHEIEFSFVNEVYRYPLRAGCKDVCAMNLMRLFYLFSNGRTAFNLFLKKQECVVVTLFKGKDVVGSANLELTDFRSDFVVKKDYCKYMAGSQGPLLKASIGVFGEQSAKVSEVKLRAYNSIYLPPNDFTFPDAIPEEWLEIIPDKSTRVTMKPPALPVQQTYADLPKATRSRPSMRKKSSRRSVKSNDTFATMLLEIERSLARTLSKPKLVL